MSKHETLKTVANESVDQLKVAREYLGWFESLSWALTAALKSGHENHAHQLAGAIHYLCNDYGNLLDSEVNRLKGQLTDNVVKE